MTLLPWQKWLLIHMLELLPDNSLRFRYVVVLVARQNGKSTVSQVLGLWFMYVYGTALIIGTAQDLDTAEEVWRGAVDMIYETDDDDVLVRPKLEQRVHKLIETNGKHALVLKPTKTSKKRKRWKIKAANRRAGRGLSGDVIFLDELREHQSWAAWGAITKTTTGRAFALILAMSNAGDSTSIVLRHLRMMAHEALGDPDGIVKAAKAADGDEVDEPIEEIDLDEHADDFDQWEEEVEDQLGIFEWSARPDRPRNDRDGWVEANPSLGYEVGDLALTEKTLASMCRTDPEWVFRTESLCQWPGFTLAGPFPPGSWDAGRWKPTRDDARPPKIVGKVKACVAMSHDRKSIAIAFAGRNEDGLPQVEVVAMRPGSDWVKPWLSEKKRRKRVTEIAGRPKGPEGELMKALLDADLPVVDWAGDDIPAWTGEFYDLVSAGAVDEDGTPAGLRHLPQAALDVAAANATTAPAGLRFRWDDAKSPVEIVTLVAATGAVGLLLTSPDVASAYEEHGLEVV